MKCRGVISEDSDESSSSAGEQTGSGITQLPKRERETDGEVKPVEVSGSEAWSS